MAKKNKKKKEFKLQPVTLRENPSFQEVMANIRKRRKQNARKK